MHVRPHTVSTAGHLLPWHGAPSAGQPAHAWGGQPAHAWGGERLPPRTPLQQCSDAPCILSMHTPCSMCMSKGRHSLWLGRWRACTGQRVHCRWQKEPPRRSCAFCQSSGPIEASAYCHACSCGAVAPSMHAEETSAACAALPAHFSHFTCHAHQPRSLCWERTVFAV